MNPFRRYYNWLHGQWPAGKVEKLPVVGENGSTNIPGIRVIGDLSGVPLLKFSSETAAKAVHAFLAEPDFEKERSEKPEAAYDLAIIGGGTSGFSAAIEAKRAGLNYILIESSSPFSTIKNFPKAKPIYTYPSDMEPSGGIEYAGRENDVKESLLEDLQQQATDAGVESTNGHIEKISKKKNLFHLKDSKNESKSFQALRVIVAIGRSGDFRKLEIPGEESDKVSNRLHDPADFSGKNVLVVGGGDSAVEAAAALAEAGAKVTISYRKTEFNRPKPENAENLNSLSKNGKIDLILSSNPTEIRKTSVTLDQDGETLEIENDHVFALIGRNPPLDFFRKSGLDIANEHNLKWWLTMAASLIFFIWLYHWKAYLIPENSAFSLDPAPAINRLSSLTESLKAATENPKNILGTLKSTASERSFYYTLAYSLMIVIFGIRRIRRRKTPYVTAQTIALTLIQCIPLFLLPYIILPWMGNNGMFESGLLGWIENQFFPDGSYWRSFGFILAWPLFVYNFFTDAPLWGWLILGFIQTFVIIPWIIRYWGKGSYCGWICSCGALAETVGDKHRHKMPHGPAANKFNMIGQVFLAFAVLIMLLRIIGWIFPSSFAASAFTYLLYELPFLNYEYFIDLVFAGIIGVAFYFHLSGRVWCRFACPLAALMHIYARFTKFRIFADKQKCISCNVCTTVCHQGIDVMAFANKGKPMNDPQCVRCSACVQQCPTGVLYFGRYSNGPEETRVKILDSLPASPVRMKEKTEQK